MQGLFSSLDSIRKDLVLDLHGPNLERPRFLVNKMLLEQAYFFRVYELRKKFCYLIHTNSQKKKKKKKKQEIYLVA